MQLHCLLAKTSFKDKTVAIVLVLTRGKVACQPHWSIQVDVQGPVPIIWVACSTAYP